MEVIDINNQLIISKYPNLKDFQYNSKTNTLATPYGFISLGKLSLSDIDEAFFKMDSYDVYLYILSRVKEMEIDNSFIESILYDSKDLGGFDNPVEYDGQNITNIYNISNYISIFFNYCNVYFHNKDYIYGLINTNENVRLFVKSFIEYQDIINAARNKAKVGGNDAASMLIKVYDEALKNAESESQEKGFSRQRSSSKYGNSNVDDKEDLLGIAGFSSILIIIIITILFGIFLAIKFIN